MKTLKYAFIHSIPYFFTQKTPFCLFRSLIYQPHHLFLAISVKSVRCQLLTSAATACLCPLFVECAAPPPAGRPCLPSPTASPPPPPPPPPSLPYPSPAHTAPPHPPPLHSATHPFPPPATTATAATRQPSGSRSTAGSYSTRSRWPCTAVPASSEALAGLAAAGAWLLRTRASRGCRAEGRPSASCFSYSASEEACHFRAPSA